MGFLENLSIKRQLEKLNMTEEDSAVELEEAGEERSKSAIFDRLALPVAKLVAPDSALHQESYFKVGDTYTRTLYIHNYPRQVDDNWLRDMLRFRHAVDVAIYIQPLDIKKFLDQMRQRISRDEASIQTQIEQGQVIDARRQARLNDTREYVEAVSSDITRPFQVMVAVTLRADSLEELDNVTEEFERSLTSVKTRRATWRHEHGFHTTLPLMQNKLYDMQAIRGMHTQGLMSMFPFSSAELTHESGVLVGVSQHTGSPIILNRFLQPQIKSPNTGIFGTTGSGKSYFAKIEMLRWSYLGVPVMVLDPSGEYRRVCEGLGGTNIEISLDSNHVINPLDFSNAVRPGHNPLREKIAFITELLGVMVRDRDGAGNGVIYDAVTKKIVDNALQETYRQFGYLAEDPETQMSATSEQMPRLSDLYSMLERMSRFDPDPMNQERLRPLLAAMGTYVNDGALAPLFDQLTTVDLRSHFINFDYSGLPPQYLPLAMHLVLEYIRTSFFTREQQRSGVKRLLYVDEAQILMKELETAHFLEYTARTCRKYGIGLTVMTQNVGVFTRNDDGSENKAGTGILSNCTIKVLLKQEPNEERAVREAFDLTQSEVSRLLAAAAGQGLIFVGNETVWFNSYNMASAREHAMLTTTPDEIHQLAAQQQAQQQLQGGYGPVVDESHQLRGGPAAQQAYGQPQMPPAHYPPPAAPAPPQLPAQASPPPHHQQYPPAQPGPVVAPPGSAPAPQPAVAPEPAPSAPPARPQQAPAPEQGAEVDPLAVDDPFGA